MMKTLTVNLTGLLQSYGNEATFERRTTYHYPSKSAVIGMIAAGLGYRRDDQRIESLNKLGIAVRIDQRGKIMTDFHTVRPQNAKNSKLTYRDYLQDAVFVVAIGSGDDNLIGQIKYALRHPKFQLFLGRRANVPAGVLWIEEFDTDPMTVLKELPWQASDWFKKRMKKELYSAEVVADWGLEKGADRNLIQVKDQVGSFNVQHRYHKYRPAIRTFVTLKNNMYQENSGEHDVWSSI